MKNSILFTLLFLTACSTQKERTKKLTYNSSNADLRHVDPKLLDTLYIEDQQGNLSMKVRVLAGVDTTYVEAADGTMQMIITEKNKK